MQSTRVIGIFAHVDAGKTTLSYALASASGQVQLDTELMEQRGMTVFSKVLSIGAPKSALRLVDTPGHEDFSLEAQRIFPVIDAALIVVEVGKPLAPTVRWLWKECVHRQLPTVLFLNKADLYPLELENLLLARFEEFHREGIPAVYMEGKGWMEELALLHEEWLSIYLETNALPSSLWESAFSNQQWVPAFCGSARTKEGVQALQEFLEEHIPTMDDEEAEINLQCYKVEYREQRLCWVRLRKGRFVPKMRIGQEKIQEIRRYEGSAYTVLSSAEEGDILGLIGLNELEAGTRWLFRKGKWTHYREYEAQRGQSYLRYCLERTDAGSLIELEQALEQLREQMPEFAIEPASCEISLTGSLMQDLIQEWLKEREIAVQFVQKPIAWRESPAAEAIGVGHFEPLRHYAEVMVWMTPADPGCGVQVDWEIPPEDLNDAIRSRIEHALTTVRGTRRGALLTDVHWTVLAVKHHERHSQNKDFEEAAMRAARHALMQTSTVLLEPWMHYQWRTAFDQSAVLLPKLEQRHFEDVQMHWTASGICFEGQGAAQQLLSLIEEERRSGISVDAEYELIGYGPHTEDIESDYDPEADLQNPPHSVFCSHGQAVVINWRDVLLHAHLPVPTLAQVKARYQDDMFEVLYEQEEAEQEQVSASPKQESRNVPISGRKKERISISRDEVDAILQQTLYANQNQKKRREKEERERLRKRRRREERHRFAQEEQTESPENRADRYRVRLKQEAKPRSEYLLMDGYNLLHAWASYAPARGMPSFFVDQPETLVHFCEEMAHLSEEQLMLVFDAYKVSGGRERVEKRGNLYVVYTKEAETADAYIARVSRKWAKKEDVHVATSDRSEQIIVQATGAQIVSADLLYRIFSVRRQDALQHESIRSVERLQQGLELQGKGE